jgi:hypothetical protein
MAATHHGESWSKAQPATTFSSDELKEMDDIEKKIVADNQALRQELKRLSTEFASVVSVVKDLKPILDETVAAKQQNAETLRVKAKLSLDLTPDQIAEAKKATGESDAVAAVAIWDRSRAKSEEAKAKVPEPPKTPRSNAREVKPATSADEIYNQLRSNVAKES